MMALYLKELRETQWKLIVGLAVAAAVAASLPLSFELVKGTVGMFADIPLMEGIRKAIEEQASDYRLYLWANWYGKNLPQHLILFAAIVGGPALAGERSAGTLQFLLSRPVSRAQVFLAKYAAGAGVIAANIVVGTIAALITTYASGRPVDVLWFFVPVIAQTLGGLCLLSLAMLFSALFDDAVKAGVIAGVAGMLLTLVESVGPLRGRLIFGMMAESRSFRLGVPNPLPLFILAAMASVLGFLAYQVFRKRDV
jgi:ABC-type transport system involved in multi-copper enzyme maturation permease subunit